MSRSLSRPMRVPRNPSLVRGRDSDAISRRMLIIGGVALAALMLILSTQTSRARSADDIVELEAAPPAEVQPVGSILSNAPSSSSVRT